MLNKTLFFFFGFSVAISLAQNKDSLYFKNGIDKPSLLPTHHFGIFSSRINSNFKFAPTKRTVFSINHTSGNSFQPFIEAYFPKAPQTREQLSHIKWHDRPFTFVDQSITPAEYMNIVVDAVIKEFRVNLNFPINNKQELNLNIRSYLITKGKYPFSIFTSDETIEWFHSSVIKNEDPFGRRYYGLNQVNFRYLDRNGRILELGQNDFFIGGIELAHYYYPDLKINKTRNIALNFGSHLGLNTSRFNTSLDIGLSASAIKKINLKNLYQLHFALGSSVLRKNLINFKNVVDLGNNRFLGKLESQCEITKYTKKGHYNAFGINYQIQSRYNQKKEQNYFKLLGNWKEIGNSWQNGVYTLYTALQNWSFIYTYGTPKLKLSIYLNEDFKINNAPDLQTGIGLTLPL